MPRPYKRVVVPRLDESDASLIAAYWSFVPAAGAPVYEARPDAQSDIVFSLRDGRPSLLVVGTHERAIDKPTAGVETLCARLAPGTVSQLFEVPATALRGAAVPLAELWGDDGLCDRLAAADRATRWRVLREAIASRRRPSATSALTVEAIRRLPRVGGIAALAAELGVGERRLRRAFDRDVGLDPRAVRSLVRLHRALALLATQDCTTAAVDAGYFDQPHLNAQFRRWLGCTPEQARRRVVVAAPAALATRDARGPGGG